MQDGNGRGGARGAEARARLLAAAESEFLENGFAAASTNRIAERAGASKATLFRHFDNKEILFAKVIEASARRAVDDIDGLTANIDAPQAWLLAFGTAALDSVLSPAQLQMMRLLVMEAPRAPHLGPLFGAMGPPQYLAKLVERLERWNQTGALAVASPAGDGVRFFDLLCGGVVMRSLTQQGSRMTPAERDHHVRQCVDLMLLAWRPGASGQA